MTRATIEARGERGTIIQAMFPLYASCIFQTNFRRFCAPFMAVFFLIFCPLTSGQEPAKPHADAGGMGTGLPRPPAEGSPKRAITSGGFVGGAAPFFLDVTPPARPA